MKKKDSKKEGTFDVTVSISGKKYTGSGKTVLEALEKLTIRNPKGRIIMTVKHGDNSKDRVLMQTHVNRLFLGHGLMREVALKQVSSLFDGI